MKSRVRLAPALQIGFSGHRKLSDERRCRDVILKVLTDWQAKLPGGISGLSSIAAGGDLIFAEACFELGIPLRVLLPLPQAQFREDFDAATWSRAESALQRAASFEVVDGGHDRPECYYECGLETVLQSGLMVVLWNGLPGRGIGGTGEMAQCSKGLGNPVIWIHSETGGITHWNASDSWLNDPELTFFNCLPDRKATPGVSPQQGAVAWFHKLDENANQVAPQFRRIMATPILCAGAGSVLTVAAYNFKAASSVLFGVSALLGVVATLAPKLLRAKQTQQNWAKIRAAAEVSRSFLALWNTPARYRVLDKGEVPELHGMLEALNHLKIIAGSRNRQSDYSEFKTYYQKERIDEQVKYFSWQAKRSDRVMSRALAVIRCSVILAILGNLFFVFSSQVFHLMPSGTWTSWLNLGVVLGFQLAAGIGTMIVINDYARRRQRFLETRRLVQDYNKQLEQAQSWPSVLRVVTRIEKALLTELIEWRALFRNQKIGKWH